MPEKQSENTFLLQIKGDASFSLFSQVKDVESLSETWKLCSKVAGHLEQGKRLENLSWRLFHLHSTMATQSVNNGTDTFEKISKETGKKLDREKHLGLSQLQAPPLMTCRRMNQPMTGGLVNCTALTSSTHISFSPSYAWDLDFRAGSLSFGSLISSFSPLELLDTSDYFSPEAFNVLENEGSKMENSATAWASSNYLHFNDTTDGGLDLKNKLIEEYSNNFKPVQEVADISRKNNPGSLSVDSVPGEPFILGDWEAHQGSLENQFMGPISSLSHQMTFQNAHFNQNIPGGIYPTEMNYQPTILEEKRNRAQGNTQFSMEKSFKMDIESKTKTEKVVEKRKRRNPMATRFPKFVGVPAVPERSPGDVEKSICFNCRGTHTPLWRRGPNDEILCNACGVFYNVHKKNRPPNPSKCNYLGKASSKFNSDTESQGTRIECTNCNAKATPMWRKAPDGSLLCNACALYFKCHKRFRRSNCSKTTLSQPFGEVNQTPKSSHINKNPSLGMIPPLNFELSNHDSNVLSDPKNTLIDSLDQEIDGRNNYFKEPHEFDFLKTYPAFFFNSSNV